MLWATTVLLSPALQPKVRSTCQVSSRITAVITEPERKSCKQKKTRASPASCASHCYAADPVLKASIRWYCQLLFLSRLRFLSATVFDYCSHFHAEVILGHWIPFWFPQQVCIGEELLLHPFAKSNRVYCLGSRRVEFSATFPCYFPSIFRFPLVQNSTLDIAVEFPSKRG